MKIASIASIALALVASATGIRSAWLWHRASRVQVMPMWETDGRIEPLDPTNAQAEWIVALLQTATKAGDLNRKAAVWTAATILLSTIASLVGAAA